MTPHERAELKRKIDAAVRAQWPSLKEGARPGGWKKLGVRTDSQRLRKEAT
jgi:hypothetical protein